MGDFVKLRVAHLLDGKQFGGAEQMVRRLMHGAACIHVEPFAYCLSEGRLTAFLRNEGLKVYTIGGPHKFSLSAITRLVQRLQLDHIDVLQAHTSRTHLMARIASRWLRLRQKHLPNITTIHSPIAQDDNTSYRRHPLRAWVERWGRPWRDAVVTVSEEEGLRLVKEERLKPEKWRWIPNGLDPAPLFDHAAARQYLDNAVQDATGVSWPENALIVVMVAQMRPRKGPEVLLKAMAIASAKENIRLLMIGGDEFVENNHYLDQLSIMAKTLGISERVWFTGFVPEPWMLARGADLCVLPSLFGEGLPLVLLEAMNHSLPLEASDSAGNRELVLGKSGELVIGELHRVGDHQALAQHLIEAAKNPLRLRKQGEAARERFLKHYSLELICRQWRSLYDELTGTE